MSDTLIESASYDATITAPTDGDTRNAASVRTPLQSLANRTKYFYDLVVSNGIKRVSTFSSFTTLRAYTGQADGDIAVVVSYGVYRFIALSLNTETEPVRIVPTGGIGGTWRMIGAGTSAMNIANGLGQLDAAAKLPAANTHGAALSVTSWQSNTLASVTSAGSTVYFPTTEVTVTSEDGAFFLVLGTIQLYHDTGASLQARIYGKTGAGSYAQVPAARADSPTPTTTARVFVGGLYTASGSGTTSFEIAAQGTVSGANAYVLSFDMAILRFSA